MFLYFIEAGDAIKVGVALSRFCEESELINKIGIGKYIKTNSIQ